MNTIFPKSISSEPTTFFIHGTSFPVVTPLLHLGCKTGVSRVDEYPDKELLPRIGRILHEKDTTTFPLAGFYLFGWSGRLSFKERKQAAADLYMVLKDKQHPVTLICHSHGCNVALNLAEIAKEKKDADFHIDRLILLAGPVQEATKKYIESPIFKKIISFYSASDVFQVIDPQGLQQHPTKKQPVRKDQPLFSERLWPINTKLTQVKVLFGKTDPWHIDFILEKFIKFLPNLLERVATLEHETQKNHFTAVIENKTDSFELISEK